MRFAVVVTGLVYGTQQMGSAFQSVRALIVEGHELSSVFFCREGVYNANQLISPTSDEFDPVCSWQQLNMQHGMALNTYVAVVLRRGVVDKTEAGRLGPVLLNLQTGFALSRLGALAKTSSTCDRMVQS